MKIKNLYNSYRELKKFKREGRYGILYVDFEEGDSWVNEYCDENSWTSYSNEYIVNIFRLLNTELNIYPETYQEFKTAVENVDLDSLWKYLPCDCK